MQQSERQGIFLQVTDRKWEFQSVFGKWQLLNGLRASIDAEGFTSIVSRCPRDGYFKDCRMNPPIITSVSLRNFSMERYVHMKISWVKHTPLHIDEKLICIST